MSTPALAILGLLTLSSTAAAESGRTLPEGSAALYAGAGLHTWSKLRYADGSGDGDGPDDGELNRVFKPRLDLWGGFTPWRSLQLSAWAPVVYSFPGVDDSDTNPCPDAGPEGFCDPVFTVAEVGVQARYGLGAGPLSVAPSLGVVVDSWNAATRMRYTAVGDGTVDLVPGVVAEVGTDLGGPRLAVVGGGHYHWHVVRRTVEQGSAGPFVAPGDEVSWLGELQLSGLGPLSLTLGADGFHRLWGLDWEGAYYDEYWSTDERWTTLKYEHVRGQLKVGLALGERLSLHGQVGRVVSVRNGPPDAWDAGLGLSLYLPPAASRGG